MSLDKAIEHGKEKRKPYRKSQAFDHTCRPHGTCGWCAGNRAHGTQRRIPADTSEQLVDRNGGRTEDSL